MSDDDHIMEAACRLARVSGMSVEQAEAAIRGVLNAYQQASECPTCGSVRWTKQ